MSNIKDFNFFKFLSDIVNQSLDPLQGNAKFNDLVSGMEFVFNKLYRRVQEIKIINTVDLKSDRDFVKYLPNNEKVIDSLNAVTAPYKDLILEQLSLYLDTDHFKDTVAMMMRLWQKRASGGGLIGSNEENIQSFIEEHIIPAFKFFTMNAGDLHKSKGVKVLLDRLFEFYGQVDAADISFDGTVEHDDVDLRGKRFQKFTSLREGITLSSLLKNYENVQIFTSANLKITNYIELGVHRFAVADNFLFISRKDREDWHIINIVDDVYRLNKYYLVIRQHKNLYVYSDRINLYDTITNEFVLPEVLSDISITSVEYIPKVMNIEDKFGQYHENNLYFITSYLKPAGGFGCFQLTLRRLRYRSEFDTLVIETIEPEMGLTYLSSLYLPLGEYPRTISISSIDYIWLDFYDAATTDTFEFYPNPLNPASLAPVKCVYSFILENQSQVANPNTPGGYDYPIGKYVCVTRDSFPEFLEGFDEGFTYLNLSYISNDLVSKYILQQRVVSSFLQTELDTIIGGGVKAKAVMDLFIPQQDITYKSEIYKYIGPWNAANTTNSPPSATPNDGDYWIVSNDGNIELSGITHWQYGDVIVWNGKFNYWMKNNELKDLVTGNNISNIINHRLLVIGDKLYFNEEDNTDPYWKNCGIFEIQLSRIKLNISDFTKLFWIDVNPIERFGDDPNVFFSFVDQTLNRYMLYSVRMNGFFDEHDIADMTRVLKNFPMISALPVIYKMEVTDEYLIAYCEKFINIDNSKSTAIICENTNYNLPFGIRSNRINVSYDADVRLTTRERQPFFREYTVKDNVKTYINDEEVDTFKATLTRYSPINSLNEFIQEDIDIGISTQVLADGTTVDNFEVEIPNYGSKAIKEISKLNTRDLLQFTVYGNPLYPNCDCRFQNNTLFIHNFQPLTLFYDYLHMSVNPGLVNLPSCVPAIKLGTVNDIYSSYQDVCRFDTDWFYYLYEDGVSTIPYLIRSKFMINLFNTIQYVTVLGASEPLTFNWSLYCLIDILDNEPLASIPEWTTIVSEETFMPLKINGECNPIGNYYTTNGSVPPTTIVSPWDIYHVIAAEISTVYNCNYTPWTPIFSSYL